MKMPIKCCCDAGKLLGFVDVQEGLKENDKISFCTMNGPLELPVGGIHQAFAQTPSYLAIKSMDTPTEVLASIPGFEPYTGTRAEADAKISAVTGKPLAEVQATEVLIGVAKMKDGEVSFTFI